jgi:hypothetical protein
MSVGITPAGRLLLGARISRSGFPDVSPTRDAEFTPSPLIISGLFISDTGGGEVDVEGSPPEPSGRSSLVLIVGVFSGRTIRQG